MSTHNICFLLKIRKIYIIIWILFLSRAAMKFLSQDKLIEISYFSSGNWDKLDKSGMAFPEPCWSTP